jgi:hypothetical protein
MSVASSLHPSYAIRRILGMRSRACFFRGEVYNKAKFSCAGWRKLQTQEIIIFPLFCCKKTAGFFSDRPAALPEKLFLDFFHRFFIMVAALFRRLERAPSKIQSSPPFC